MISFVKAAVRSISDGSFVANAILIKNTDDGSFHLITDDSVMTSPLLRGSNVVLDGRTFRSANMLRACNLPAHEGDSFYTMMLRINGDENGIRSGVGMQLHLIDITGDEVVSPESGAVVDYDALFVQAAPAVSEDGRDGEVAIKSGYTRTNMYHGFFSYHHNPGRSHFNTPVNDTKPYRMGIELELYAVDRRAYDKITNTQTNWFQCESDGSLNQASNPIEIKTIPLRADDATSTDFWDAPMARLKTLAKSKGYTSTGLHVHISKEILGSTESERQANLGKLVVFYQYFVENDPEAHRKNVVICGRERGYSDSDYKTPVGDFAQKCGMKTILGTPGARELMDGVTERARNQRSDINLGNWGSYGTIEFRKAKGIISKTRLAAVCTWWEQMCLYCKETPADELDFNTFFTKVCNEHPCVAYFFPQEDTEC